MCGGGGVGGGGYSVSPACYWFEYLPFNLQNVI